ncbi:MAG: asparagine synthase (glutamine-hydrolyzing) [Pseudomonadota bacterium]
MCGVAGYLFHSNELDKNASRRLLEDMVDSMVHRGPDSQGVWEDPDSEIGLAHRRLAIIDLSPAGHQPMFSDCGRFVLAYNGEIYNHLDLRRTLEGANAAPNWRGYSDTETLLAAIAYWGLDECLKRCSGMFAFALWDRKQKRLSLARDRFGEKPLYWGWAGNTLVFASELKALRCHPDFGGEICRTALAQYFRYCYVPSPLSIYNGIYKLEPGSILEVGQDVPGTPPKKPLRPGEFHGSLSIRHYWSLNDTIEAGHRNPITDDEEALACTEDALNQAVSRQMISDVPLGAFLSGGIDSSLIVALMQRASSRPVKTFTIGFDVPAFNEAPHAAAVARHLGTDHTELTVTEKEARDVIPLLPEIYDEPFADSSQIPTYLVCKAARSSVTVALSGDGGDELFGGYNRYFWGPRIWRHLDWLPTPMRRKLGLLIASLPVSAWDSLGNFFAKIPGQRSALSRPGDKAHKLALSLQTVRTSEDLYRSLISEWMGESVVSGHQDTHATLLDDPLPSALEDDPVGKMMAQDMRTYLPDDILCKVDRAAMGVSLETRAPFLDPDVVNVSARLSNGSKIRNGEGKWALRKILYQNVPQQMIERPKAGFGVPVGEWLRGPLLSWAEELLATDSLAKDGFLEPEPIRQVWAEHLSGRRDYTHRLWSVLMFQAWRANQT